MKNFLHKACLTILLFVVGVCSGWADEVTFDLSNQTEWKGGQKSLSESGITISFSSVTWNQAGYSTLSINSTMTITSDENITRVEFEGTVEGTSKGGVGNLSANIGTYVTNASNASWSGESKSITFSVSSTKDKNVRIKTIKVIRDTSGSGEGGEGGEGGDSGEGDGEDTPTPTPTPSVNSGYFVKITSEADIVNGGQYIIVREDSEKTYAAGINEGSTKYLSINEIPTTGTYYGAVNGASLPYVYTLSSSTDGYYYLTNDGKYLTGANGATELTLTEKASAGGLSEWNLIVTLQKNVTIQNRMAKSGSGDNATLREIRFNNGNRFAAYASTTGSVVTLYRYVPSVSVSSVGYATYYNEFAYVMPEGLEGKIMEENTKTGDIVACVVFNAGEVVPAETALLIKGSEGVYPLLYTDANPDADNVEYCNKFNLLRGSLVDADTTGGSVYYKLANGGNGLGWYWGTAGGAAFTNPAHKAYIALDAAVGSNESPRFIAIDFGRPTAIENIETNTNNEIYDLAGRRVKNASNGLYIVNGKKVFR